MKHDEMALAPRATGFAGLIAGSEITGRDGTAIELEAGIAAIMQILDSLRATDGSLYVIGNGGSAGVASHAVVDFVHMAKLRAFTLHDISLLTCMTNDYGYENAFAKILSHISKPGDVLLAISSSGNSHNILNAAKHVAQNGGTVVTLSGFSAGNTLRSLGAINIWLDSRDYGLVEIGHQFILHNISDRLALLRS